MKMYIFLIPLILIGSCKTSNTLNSSSHDAISGIVLEDNDYCPEDGNCNITLYKNSSIVVKKDTIESYYPVIEKGENIVIEYKFSVKGPEGTADGDYSETVHFEINPAIESMNTNDKDLEQLNMLFGKHCFCKGEAGYYKVNKGNFVLQKTKGEIIVDLSFKLNEVSHRITRIKKKIVL